MKTPHQILREKIGYTANPMVIDDGAAFAGFLSFAFGESEQARALQNQWADADGIDKKPEGSKASKEDCAAYVDWLIVNHWGEA